MDRIINKHIDTIEELESQLERIIEQEVSQIDIDAIIVNSQAELARVAENIKRVFLDEYADKAVELGFDFGRKIKERIGLDKTLKVDDSNDPKLNAESDNSKQD